MAAKIEEYKDDRISVEEVQTPVMPVSEREKLKVDTIQLKGKLPSGGKTYPLRGYKIFYNTYGYTEVRRFSNKNLSFNEHCKLVMEGIRTEGFDKWDLTFFDFMYIAVLRKLSSLRTPKFKIPYTCSQCGKESAAVSEIAQIDFDDLNVELPVNYHVDDKVFSFMPLTIKNYLRLIDPDDASARLAACCTSHKFEEVFSMINSEGDIGNFELFEKIEDSMFHGIKPFEFICREKIGEFDKEGAQKAKQESRIFYDERPTCGKKYVTELEGGELLILPFRESEDHGGNRVSFGLSQAD